MSEAENLPIRDPATGHYLKGKPGGPGRGHSIVKRTFLGDMQEAWLTHGAKLIERVIQEDPSTALRVFASLVPKELLINDLKSVNKMDRAETEAAVMRMLASFVAAPK